MSVSELLLLIENDEFLDKLSSLLEARKNRPPDPNLLTVGPVVDDVEIPDAVAAAVSKKRGQMYHAVGYFSEDDYEYVALEAIQVRPPRTHWKDRSEPTAP